MISSFKPLKYSYDLSADVIEIEGIKFSGDVFRLMRDPTQPHTYRVVEGVLRPLLELVH